MPNICGTTATACINIQATILTLTLFRLQTWFLVAVFSGIFMQGHQHPPLLARCLLLWFALAAANDFLQAMTTPSNLVQSTSQYNISIIGDVIWINLHLDWCAVWTGLRSHRLPRWNPPALGRIAKLNRNCRTGVTILITECPSPRLTTVSILLLITIHTFVSQWLSLIRACFSDLLPQRLPPLSDRHRFVLSQVDSTNVRPHSYWHCKWIIIFTVVTKLKGDSRYLSW